MKHIYKKNKKRIKNKMIKYKYKKNKRNYYQSRIRLELNYLHDENNR